VHFVLQYGKKDLGRPGTRIVVDAGSVNFQHLTPENLFRRADVTNARQQFIKIVAAPGSFQTIVVHGKTFDNELTQAFGGPYAELGAPV